MPESILKPEAVDRVLLREPEAARSMGVSIRTLFEMRRRGEIAFVSVGRSVRYRPSALESWAKSKEQRVTN